MDADESFPLFVMINVFQSHDYFCFFFLRILWQLNSQYTIATLAVIFSLSTLSGK